MPDTLAKLFGSHARVKLLRLFLFNPRATYTASEAALRSRVPQREAIREITSFLSMKLITKHTRDRAGNYSLNTDFPYISSLQNLLLNASTQAEEIYERIKRMGNVKLVVVSGIFVGEWEGTIDLLVVADRVQEKRLDTYMKVLESEVGREIRYALLNTQDFFYRLNINDHMLRDVLDYSHRIMYDRLDIGLK